MDLDLTSSREKLKHAIGHIGTLRDEIGYPRTRVIPLRRQFESKERAVVYRIDRVIEIAEDWPLVTGDAIHDLRCALDHLAWQLALRFFRGVEPTERKVIRNIQFPIVSDKDLWPTHPHREYMLDVDAKKLEQFQPFNLGPKSRAAGALHPTEGLALVSDTDKHRQIQLLSFTAGEGQFRAPVPGDFVDCVPVVNADGQTLMTLNALSGAIRQDDEVARILVGERRRDHLGRVRYAGASRVKQLQWPRGARGGAPGSVSGRGHRICGWLPDPGRVGRWLATRRPDRLIHQPTSTKTVYAQTRTAIFHAKQGRIVFLPQHLGTRTGVVDTLERLSRLYLDLVDKALGVRRAAGVMALGGFNMAMQPLINATSEVAVSDDSSPLDPDDTAVNPGGGSVAQFAAAYDPALDRPGCKYWLGELHSAQFGPVQRVSRLGLLHHSTLTQVERLDDPVSLLGVDVLQIQLGHRLVNTNHPRATFAT